MPKTLTRKTPPMARPKTVAELQRRLGGIALERIVCAPPPGTATIDDIERLRRERGGLYELIEGTLVEKAVGMRESILAMWIGHLLAGLVYPNRLGFVLGEAGGCPVAPLTVLMPDVGFIRTERLPVDAACHTDAYPAVGPDLVVEVLSPSNTADEIAAKLARFFAAGTQLAWVVDPAARTVAVYTAPDARRALTEADTLDGGEVVPGLSLEVRRVFENMLGPKPPRRRKKA